MRIKSIWLRCKVTLALAIVVSFIAPIAMCQQIIPICSVSGSNFQLYGPYTIASIEVSHSYGGQGWVKLIDANGNEYGPWWNVDTSSSIWKVYPKQYFMAGSYRLVDSDPGSYQGQATIYGYS